MTGTTTTTNDKTGGNNPGNDGGQQQEFTPPASQAELDRIITDRISRERSKFADYDDLKAKAEKFDTAEDAAKTEAQKQADALAVANKELASYKHREQVAEWSKAIAEGSHIDPSLLRGSTEEELQAHFDQLKSVIPEPTTQQQSQRRSIPGVGLEPDANKANVPLREQIAAAEAEGNQTLVGRLKALQLGQSA